VTQGSKSAKYFVFCESAEKQVGTPSKVYRLITYFTAKGAGDAGKDGVATAEHGRISWDSVGRDWDVAMGRSWDTLGRRWDQLGRRPGGEYRSHVIAGIAVVAGIGKAKPFATDEHGRAQTGLDGY
jgi:hypothetical protein